MTDAERRAMEDAIVRSIKIEHQKWLAQGYSYESSDGKTVKKVAPHRVETVGELFEELTGEFYESHGHRNGGWLKTIDLQVGWMLDPTDPETDGVEFAKAKRAFKSSLWGQPLTGLLGPSGENGKDWAATADPHARQRLAALCEASSDLPTLAELVFAAIHGIGTIDAECKAWSAAFWQRFGLPTPTDAAVRAFAEGAMGEAGQPV